MRPFLRPLPRHIGSKLPRVNNNIIHRWFPDQHIQLCRKADAYHYTTTRQLDYPPPPIRYIKVPPPPTLPKRGDDDSEGSQNVSHRPIRFQTPREPAPQTPHPPDETKTAKVKALVSQGHLFDSTSLEPLIVARELRNACKCESCVHPSDRQRNYHFADIPEDIGIESYEVDAEGTYSVRWKNDVPGFENHVSLYTKSDITEAADPSRKYGHSVLTRPLFLWRSEDLDLDALSMSYESVMGKSEGLANILNQLSTYGLAFVTSVPKDEASVRDIAERIGILRNTFYGPTWDVRSVTDAKNVAYTSRNLGFHMDLLYMREPPGFQLLHCLENTCEGGHSRFVDTFKALDVLVSQRGQGSLKSLANRRIAYEYSNDGAYYYGVKPIVAMGTHPSVYENAENPHVLRHLSRIYWSPPFVAPNMRLDGDSGKHSLQTVKAFAEVLESPELVLTTKLSPGTCVIFDNLRVAHARTAFDTSAGHRCLKGAYVDSQDLRSRQAAVC